MTTYLKSGILNLLERLGPKTLPPLNEDYLEILDPQPRGMPRTENLTTFV